MDRAVVNAHTPILGLVPVEKADRVLHPRIIQTVREVFTGVGTAAFFASLRRVHRDCGVDQKVLQLHGLDQIRVPHESLVFDCHVFVRLNALVDVPLAVFQRLLCPEYGGIVLHDLLHLKPDLGRLEGTIRIPQPIDPGQALLAGGRRQRLVRGTRGRNVGDPVGASPSEDDNVQQRVGPEPIGAVDRRTGCLSRGKETGNHGIWVRGRRVDHLPHVIGRYSAHVIVHGGQHRNRFLRHVHPGEDRGRLADPGETFGEQLWRQVVQVKVDMVLLRTHSPSLPDLHRHRP
mmetsp:Transcript_10075/g.27436  ORF Transcript_10075/g.27436 Transcript_10075/m.27436 type:complete len:289 (+) Transcript_10075:1652-2518(+)